MTDGAIKTLSASVATLGQAVQEIEGELAVLVCALAALVQTHPEPQAFAAAFRRAWLEIGAPNQALGADDASGQRMRAVLEILQDRCPAQLNVVPPGVAGG